MSEPTPEVPVGVDLLGPIGRRRFLAAAGVAGGALAATAWIRPSSLFGTARAQTTAQALPDGHVLVHIFLRGAADGLSFLPPLGDATYQTVRPGVAVPDASALALDGRFGLHPAAVRLKALFDSGQAAFVPAAGSPNSNRSHFSAQAMMERGSATDATITTGWLGRHLAGSASGSDPVLRGVSIGNGLQASMRGSEAIATPNLQSLALTSVGTGGSATQIRTAMASMYAGADATLLRDGGAAAVDVVDQITPIAATARPPSTWPTGFGTALWPIAKLIADGFPVEVATADLGGWDEHDAMGSATDPAANQTRLVGGLDTALGAFFDHIGAAATRTTVIITTEFGRRIALNGSGGTDHGRGMVMMVLGAGVAPGVHGAWPGLVDTDHGDVRVVNDYRLVLAEVLAAHRPGTDLGIVFPDFDSGRSRWLGVMA